jgi:hypothetical protein
MRAWLVLLVVGAGATAPAYADDAIEVSLTAELPAPTAQAPRPAPLFRSLVKARAGLQQADFLLSAPGAKPPAKVAATRLLSYADAGPPMAMVILIQGDVRWMGNETHTQDGDEARIYRGAHGSVARAIDELAKAGPAGSLVSVIVYAEGGDLEKAPFTDASQVTGDVLGAQQGYEDHVSRPLVAGLRAAHARLAAVQGHRRILVVIGDGTDSGDEAEVDPAVRDLARDMRAASVEVYGIYFNNDHNDSSAAGLMRMKKLAYGHLDNATSMDSIVTFAAAIAKAIDSWYVVEFPGADLPHDGRVHDFVVDVKGQPSEPVPTATIAWNPVRAGGGRRWWLWALVPILLVPVVGLVLLKRRAADGEEAAEEEPRSTAAPLPSAPARTIMMNAGGEEAMPVVGWIVAVTGPSAWQTFKLGQRETVVGTGGAAQVVVQVQDHFMSIEHAVIEQSAGSFFLRDRGSTNGVYVNSQRVASHELVDNDVFTLGRTDFRFKSIN